MLLYQVSSHIGIVTVCEGLVINIRVAGRALKDSSANLAELGFFEQNKQENNA